ncbi:hypothetical protein Golob_001395 [Gossypium lobatum]|uniref:Uncharacterized protein n=1 Tax=Gossypium lobatum TaxID=34289 RepID=A0A7J8NBB4_9ROSI|nr:hypothetical protein [Gossypium lobatum]
MSGEAEEGVTLEHTPTWIVAAICTVIVAISLAMERLLHVVGNVLKRKQQKPLFEALLKVKEEEALFCISLLEKELRQKKDDVLNMLSKKQVDALGVYITIADSISECNF